MDNALSEPSGPDRIIGPVRTGLSNIKGIPCHIFIQQPGPRTGRLVPCQLWSPSQHRPSHPPYRKAAGVNASTYGIFIIGQQPEPGASTGMSRDALSQRRAHLSGPHGFPPLPSQEFDGGLPGRAVWYTPPAARRV